MKEATRSLIIKIAQKLRMKRMLVRMWNFFKMHIYERIKVRTYDSSCNYYIVYLFGHRIGSNKKRNKSICENRTSKRIFYFKVNQQADYTLTCIQHWLNAIRYLDADFYFVCDNKNLERQIVCFNCFQNKDIKFIPSMRKELKKTAANLWTDFWENATYAHLTPFYHAKAVGTTQYWAIDADDTMILLQPQRVAEILREAEGLAAKKGLSALSLDMWRSRTLGQHWSLGIVYITDNMQLCRCFEENKDLSWIRYYSELDIAFNVDWFFNYLKDKKRIPIGSFYIENCFFVHWTCNMLRDIILHSVYFWRDGQLIFPIIKYIYGSNQLGDIPIADCFQIDIGATQEESQDFMMNELSIIPQCSKELRKLHGLGDYGMNCQWHY